MKMINMNKQYTSMVFRNVMKGKKIKKEWTETYKAEMKAIQDKLKELNTIEINKTGR